MQTLFRTIVIFKPFKSSRINSLIDKYSNMLQIFTGKEYDIDIDEIGVKKLAHEIRSYTYGHYCEWVWLGTADDITELERQLRIDDDVLKFMNAHVDESLENLEPHIKVEQKEIVDVLDIIYNLKSD